MLRSRSLLLMLAARFREPFRDVGLSVGLLICSTTSCAPRKLELAKC